MPWKSWVLALVVLPLSDAWVTLSRAELAAGYDRLWAVSDIHGHRAEIERLFTTAGLAVSGPDGELHWDARARRQLLVVVGDLIDGGPDSAGVVRLIERMAAEAPASASRVLVLLGNHEARSLAGGRRTPGHRFLREAPAMAFVGPWLFAHAGYIDAEASEASLKAWFAEVARRWAASGRERYEQFLSGRSILDFHDWWRSRGRRETMRQHLQFLGLEAVVFGHDPAGLHAPATIAIDADGFLVKLDAGLKEDRSAGMLLRCEVQEALRRGLSACRAELATGATVELPVEPRR